MRKIKFLRHVSNFCEGAQFLLLIFFMPSIATSIDVGGMGLGDAFRMLCFGLLLTGILVFVNRVVKAKIRMLKRQRKSFSA